MDSSDDSPRRECVKAQTVASAAGTGVLVGGFAALPLAAAVLRMLQGTATPGFILLLAPAVPLLFAAAFATRAYYRMMPAGWLSLDNAKCRGSLAAMLIVLSPVVAAVVAFAATRCANFAFVPRPISHASTFFALATSPCAAIGPAVGALLLRKSVAFRVVLGLVFGFVGFLVFWGVVGMLFGWT